MHYTIIHGDGALFVCYTRQFGDWRKDGGDYGGSWGGQIEGASEAIVAEFLSEITRGPVDRAYQQTHKDMEKGGG
jgi:hypothetical protein